MTRVVAPKTFTDQDLGLVLKGTVLDLAPAVARRLTDEKSALYTDEETRSMKRVMATKKTAQPSTGATIWATQVITLPDDDADALVALGAAAECEADETEDVGALAMKQGGR